MNILRLLEKLSFWSAIIMAVFKVMPIRTCVMICLFVLFITVISERQYYNKYRKPWIDFLTMYYFFEYVQTERNKLYLTGADKRILAVNANVMKKYGRCILEEGESVVNNPQIAIECRNEAKEIMEKVYQKLEKERLL